MDFLDSSNTPVENRIYRNVTKHKHLLSALEEYHIKMKAINPEVKLTDIVKSNCYANTKICIFTDSKHLFIFSESVFILFPSS